MLDLPWRIELKVGGDNGRVRTETIFKSDRGHHIEGVEGEILIPTAQKIKAKFEAHVRFFGEEGGPGHGTYFESGEGEKNHQTDG